MCSKFAVILAALTLMSFPALAGNVTVANGQTTWQSTKCSEPQQSAALASVNSETRANQMNTFAAQYNKYAQAMQAYMDCISNEAQGDANDEAGAITRAAQGAIEDAQKKVSALGVFAQKPSSDTGAKKTKIDIE